MTYINSLHDGDKIVNIYLVKNKTQGTSKFGSEYFNITLQDKTGILDGKIWDTNSQSIEDFQAGDFVEITGDVILYNNNLQIKIERLRVVDDSEYNTSDYFLVSKRSIEDMGKELDSIINSIKYTNYNLVLKKIFIDDLDFRKKFLFHQGAKNVHHSFVGGLVEHTLSVARLAEKIASNYSFSNIDLIKTAALCHDIGKVYELIDYPTNEYSDQGHLIGHIMIGYEIVSNVISTIDGFNDIKKNELLHCILSHHGQLEFGSPKLPSLIEAIIIAAADNIDSKIEIMYEGIENNKMSKKDKSMYVGFNKYLNTNFRETSK